jgi:O-antigen/teichoic acid export membrane protein
VPLRLVGSEMCIRDSYQGASMFKKSIFITYSNSLELVLSNGLSLVVVAFLNPVSLVTFNATKTLTNSISQISNLFINPALPEMIKLYSLNKFDKILQLIKLYWLLIVSFLSVGIIIIQPVLGDLFLFWTRHKLIYPKILFVLLLFSTLINVFNKPLNSFFISTNNLKYITITTTIKFFTFLIFFYPLIKIFGFNSIGFIFLLSEIIILTYTFYIFKKHKLIINSRTSFISNFGYMTPIIIAFFSVTLVYFYNSLLHQISIIIMSTIMIIYYFGFKWHKLLNKSLQIK